MSSTASIRLNANANANANTNTNTSEYLANVPNASTFLEASHAQKMEQNRVAQSKKITEELKKLSINNPRVEISLNQALDTRLSDELSGKGYNVFVQTLLHQVSTSKVQTMCKVVVEVPLSNDNPALKWNSIFPKLSPNK